MELDIDANEVIAVLRQQLADATFQLTLLMLQVEKLQADRVEVANVDV